MYDRALLAERLETVLEALERIPRRFEGISLRTMIRDLKHGPA